MFTRVAVLSDIHGVLPALDAVLAEPDVAQAERVVITGDIAAGPQPVQVLDRLTTLGERAVWVRGNADRELVQLARGGDTSIPDPIAPWAATQLRDDQVELLGPGVQLRRTVFDPVDACARISAESGYADAAAWADEYVNARNSDTDALEAFAPRDGRP